VSTAALANRFASVPLDTLTNVMSRYSNQKAISDTAITCALGSAKVWFDNDSAAASACAIAESQPVTPPIFMMSTIARSDAPAAMAFVIP
jgi:hypothetical protein